ncbi:MAG: ABC transporter ATP-binding protein [Bacteroidia bacterium]
MITKYELIKNFFREHSLWVIATFLTGVSNSVLNVLLPLSIGKFYEIIFHDNSTKGKIMSLLHIEASSIETFFILFGLLLILKWMFTWFERYSIGVITEKFSKEMRELLFTSQLSQSVTTFGLKAPGRYLLRYSGDLSSIQRYISRGIIYFTADIVFIILALFMFYSVNAKLALALITMFPVAFLILIPLNKKLRATITEKRNQQSDNIHFISNRLNSFFTIKAFNRETPEENAFAKRSRKYYDASMAYHRINSLYQSFQPLLIYATIGLILFIVYNYRHVYHISRSDVFVFILLMLYMRTVLKRILQVHVIWQSGKLSFEKLLNIVNQPKEERATEIEIKKTEGEIVFDDVSYGYNDNNIFIKNKSFRIPARSITHISGNHGSGKSSLLKLMLRLANPLSGNIFIDDVKFDNASAFQLRKKISLVSTEAPLLGNRVYKCISYNNSDNKRQQAVELLYKLGYAKDPVDESVLDENIGEGGKSLSAGQRKLLCFARALLTNKKIILLDDPFADSDIQSTEKIIALLNELKRKHTIVIASTDLPASLNVDHAIKI